MCMYSDILRIILRELMKNTHQLNKGAVCFKIDFFFLEKKTPS